VVVVRNSNETSNVIVKLNTSNDRQSIAVNYSSRAQWLAYKNALYY